MRGGGKVGTRAVSFAPLSSVCHVDCPTRQPLDPFPLRTLELLFSVSLRRRLGGGKGGAGAVSFSPPSPVSDYCVVLPHALPASSPRVFYRAQAEAKSSGAREHLRSPGGPRRALSFSPLSSVRHGDFPSWPHPQSSFAAHVRAFPFCQLAKAIRGAGGAKRGGGCQLSAPFFRAPCRFSHAANPRSFCTAHVRASVLCWLATNAKTDRERGSSLTAIPCRMHRISFDLRS